MTRGTLATGEKVRQREVDTCSQLTPQEEHIVRLARTAALFTHDLQTRGPLELDLAHGDRLPAMRRTRRHPA